MTRPALQVLRGDIPPDAQLVTARQAATAVNVPIGTIHSWAHRRKLHPVGYDNGHPLYLLADVVHVEHATRRRPRAHRLLALTHSVCKHDQT